MGIFYQLSERINMFCKRSPSCGGHGIGRLRFLPDEFFFYFDVAFRFKRGGVRRKIAIGNIERLLQLIEINRIVHRQRRHDAESDATLEHLVQIFNRTAHRSYLKYMRAPNRI